MHMIAHHLWLEIVDVIKILEEIGENLVNWFSNNGYQQLLNSQEPNTLKLGNLHISNSLK